MLYLASETEVLILTPGSASWSTLRVDASRRRRGFLREMIGPTPRMLGVGWTIAGAVARCKPIPDPIVAVVSSRKRAVHSPGATAAQRALESYKAERESCRAIYSTQHIRSSTCGETAEDRERSRRDRHRAKLALPETSRPEGVNKLRNHPGAQGRHCVRSYGTCTCKYPVVVGFLNQVARCAG